MTHVLLLAWLFPFLCLLQRHRHVFLPFRANPLRAWFATSWGHAPHAAQEPGIAPAPLPRPIARLLHVLGPGPATGMRPRASAAIPPRFTPPIRPPPVFAAATQVAEPRPKYYDNKTKIPLLRAPATAASLRAMQSVRPVSRFWYRWYYTPAV